LAREVTLFERKQQIFFHSKRKQGGPKRNKEKNNAPHLKIIYSHELAPYK
jgi:hypothetical protein